MKAPQRITMKRINAAIAAKYPTVELIKDNGFFYLYSDNEEWGLRIAGMHQSSIMVARVDSYDIAGWVKEVDALFEHPENV